MEFRIEAGVVTAVAKTADRLCRIDMRMSKEGDRMLARVKGGDYSGKVCFVDEAELSKGFAYAEVYRMKDKVCFGRKPRFTMWLENPDGKILQHTDLEPLWDVSNSAEHAYKALKDALHIAATALIEPYVEAVGEPLLTKELARARKHNQLGYYSRLLKLNARLSS